MFNWWKPEYLKYVYVFVIGLILGGGLSYCTNGGAMTVRGDPRGCAALAQDVVTIAGFRDDGGRWAEMHKEFEAQAKKVIGSEGSYLKDAEDFAYTMKAFEFVFQVPTVSGEEAATAVYKHCMSKNGNA